MHIADANVIDLPNPVPEATVQPGSLSYRAGERLLEQDRTSLPRESLLYSHISEVAKWPDAKRNRVGTVSMDTDGFKDLFNRAGCRLLSQGSTCRVWILQTSFLSALKTKVIAAQ